MKTRRTFNVERLESRETPSGALSVAHLATPVLVGGVEDPNQKVAVTAPSSVSSAHAFNPQPDPPSSGLIIAIQPPTVATHVVASPTQGAIIAI